MKNESITLAMKESGALVARGKATAGVAPVEAVGRTLGYTETELLLAGDVLNRFAWRYLAVASDTDVNATDEETIGLPSRDDAA